MGSGVKGAGHRQKHLYDWAHWGQSPAGVLETLCLLLTLWYDGGDKVTVWNLLSCACLLAGPGHKHRSLKEPPLLLSETYCHGCCSPGDRFKPLSAIVLFQLHTWLLHIIPVDALTAGLTFVGVIKDFVFCKLFSRFQCNVHVEPLRVEAEYLTVVWLKRLVLVILTMFLRNSHKCFYAVLFTAYENTSHP